MNKFTTEINEICKRFFADLEIKEITLLTAGNINNTYKITVYNGKNVNYILQKINKFVFKEPYNVMQNTKKVSEHLNNRSVEHSCNNKAFITYVKTLDDKIYHIDSQGEYWRCYNFFDNSISYNTTDNLNIIKEVGFAYGEFQYNLKDFDAKTLIDIIPDFHNTLKRLDNLQIAFKNDEFDRSSFVKNEYEYLLSKKHLAVELSNIMTQLPIRVTHNDTKCNNVLIDVNTEKAITVIDLDTVMAGIVAFDYGDGIRSIATICDEDETDINKIKINLDKFEAFTKGFIAGLHSNLNHNEFDSLPLGILVMTLELATRFLTDYLNGDKYFKIKTPKHNLERAKCQIEVFKDFERNINYIKQYINNLKTS